MTPVVSVLLLSHSLFICSRQIQLGARAEVLHNVSCNCRDLCASALRLDRVPGSYSMHHGFVGHAPGSGFTQFLQLTTPFSHTQQFIDKTGLCVAVDFSLRWGCREHFVSRCWHSSGRDYGRYPRECWESPLGVLHPGVPVMRCAHFRDLFPTAEAQRIMAQTNNDFRFQIFISINSPHQQR